MNLVIEPLHSADLPSLLGLLERSGLPLDGVSDHLATALVVRDHEEVVGSTILEVYGIAALLRSVAVDAQLQRRGVGRQLVHAALDLAQQNGVEQVYLLTETAPDFFAHIGFQPIERAAVSPHVQQSIEFTSACPISAQVMELRLVSPLSEVA